MSKNGRHYAPRHGGKRKKEKSKAPIIILIIALVIMKAALGAFAWWYFSGKGENESETNSTSESSSMPENSSESQKTEENSSSEEETENNNITLTKGLEIEKIGNYTGMFMEDGTDEIVSGVAMIVVKNTGDEYIQYAEIKVKSGNEEGFFALSTLFPGEKVVVLEQQRKEYSKFTENVTATAENVAVFSETPTLCEDKIKIQPLNGAMNVTNVSGKDIEGDVIIYYKNTADDIYYGGITYRVRITGGIKDGEIKQIITDHFKQDGSNVVFATVG